MQASQTARQDRTDDASCGCAAQVGWTPTWATRFLCNASQEAFIGHPSGERVLLLRATTGGPNNNRQKSPPSTCGMRFLARCFQGQLAVQALKNGQDFCVFLKIFSDAKV